MEHLIDDRYNEEVFLNSGKKYSEPDLVVLFRICLAVCGITFNLLLLVLFLRRRVTDGVPTSVYCLLESLTFSNLVSSVGIIPFPAVSDVPDDTMGSIYCLLVFYPMLFWIGNIAGILSQLFITLDRYVHVVHPRCHRKHIERNHNLSRLVTLCIWIIAIFINFSGILVVSATENDECTVKWVTINQFQAFSIFIFVILYAVPTFFHVMVYCHIRYKIKRSNTYAIDVILSQQYPRFDRCSSISNDIISFFILSLLFVFFWGQDQLFFLLLNLKVISTSLLLSNYRHVATLLAYSLAFVNPIVVMLSNRQIKRTAANCRRGVEGEEDSTNDAV
ncbi:uncharacterized protein [Antedon mediterranea]|uniref:uncharacterized protein n=1 Tax=Antedon mediterranea TaxID=105859 RepID=UPI003AF9301B